MYSYRFEEWSGLEALFSRQAHFVIGQKYDEARCTRAAGKGLPLVLLAIHDLHFVPQFSIKNNIRELSYFSIKYTR
uniref:Uncharacterized protein n=1 Tax=Pararge aegeria TaxID=116150 RepID=S4P073_9NEOP